MVSDESAKLPAEKETNSVSKKKRKKKKKAKGVKETNMIEKIEQRANNQEQANVDQNDKIKKTKKRKKARKSSNETAIDNGCIDSNNHDIHNISSPSKISITNEAKAGCAKESTDQSLECSQNNQTTSNSTKKKKRKKAAIKTDTAECSVKQNESKETEDKLPVKTKKKKKQRIDKEEKQKVINKENEALQTNTQPEKKKKTKSDEKSEIHTTSNKKKKKKMKSLSMENACLTDKQPCDNGEDVSSNSVAKVAGGGEDKSPIISKKNKKAKKRKNELEIETDHKKGQTQDEISTPAKKKVKESGVLSCDQDRKDNHLGQWKTAELADSSQQEKFNRLLGGLKSKKKETAEKADGNQSVLSRLSGVHRPTGKLLWGKRKAENGGYSSMAMNAEQSKKLAGKLEEQFQDTLQFNLQKMKEGNKAKGFGFQEDPSFGKKHYIDKFKRNSVLLE